MNFTFTSNEFRDVVIVEPRVFADERGGFFETYKKSDFFSGGIKDDFLQDNHSFSTYGVVRGLHFQNNPNPQSKLVRCINGEIYDCVVDLRKSSPTFKKYFGIILSAKNRRMLYVPVGFAHGFSVLSENAEICYKVSNEYDQKCDAGIRWNDPEIAIDWKVTNPTISKKDQNLPLLKDLKTSFE